MATLFEGFVDDLSIPEDWVDESYRNDACPSWSVAGLHIYADHVDPDQREYKTPDRFSIWLLGEYNESENSFEFHTNDWGEVLRVVELRSKTPQRLVSKQNEALRLFKHSMEG
jgi:hypothetical protein